MTKHHHVFKKITYNYIRHKNMSSCSSTIMRFRYKFCIEILEKLIVSIQESDTNQWYNATNTSNNDIIENIRKFIIDNNKPIFSNFYYEYEKNIKTFFIAIPIVENLYKWLIIKFDIKPNLHKLYDMNKIPNKNFLSKANVVIKVAQINDTKDLDDIDRIDKYLYEQSLIHNSQEEFLKRLNYKLKSN